MPKLYDSRPVVELSRRTWIVTIVIIAIVALSIIVTATPGDAKAATNPKFGHVGFQVDPENPDTRIDLFCVEGLLIARSKPEGNKHAGYSSGHLLNLGLQDLCK